MASRCAPVLCVVVAACGSPAVDGPDAGAAAPLPSRARVFVDDIGEPGTVAVRGGHVYWLDRRPGGATGSRVARSPVDAVAPETVFEADDSISHWDVTSTHLYVQLVGGTLRVPLGGGVRERIDELGADRWVVAGDRLITARATARGSDLVDVTTPGAPSTLVASARAYALTFGGPDRVVAAVHLRPAVYSISIPGGVETSLGEPYQLLAMIGPHLYSGDRRSATDPQPVVLRRDGEALGAARAPLADVAVRGDEVFVTTVDVHGANTLERLAPAAATGQGSFVELEPAPLSTSIAADDRRLFWFARPSPDRGPALMVDER